VCTTVLASEFLAVLAIVLANSSSNTIATSGASFYADSETTIESIFHYLLDARATPITSQIHLSCRLLETTAHQHQVLPTHIS
jgi:hypothetical protein